MSKKTLEFFSGCLLGGAVGDALGAPIEFMSLKAIRHQYGPAGVTGMQDILSTEGDLARFTDDTQMTLFTTEGLLRANSRWHDRGLCHVPSVIHRSYLRWLHMQGVESKYIDPDFGQSLDGWLINVPGLKTRRAPGTTCLGALSGEEMGAIDNPINDSKGCGGVMRVAPVGLFVERGRVFQLGCEAAAITHGHPSGYLAAGCLALIIAGIISGSTLRDSIDITIEELMLNDGHEECLESMLLAKNLTEDETLMPGPEVVERLGEGWVAEEALAISLYCALVAEDDFTRGVLLAVNHGGDSDSTGAITGNILGALLGKSVIPSDWLDQLEMRDLVEEISSDLLTGYREGREWMEKYPTY